MASLQIATNALFVQANGIAIYPSVAALALEQTRFAVGTVVCVQTPFQFLMAQTTPPLAGQYVTSCTAAAAYGGLTTYWVPALDIAAAGLIYQAAPWTARAVVDLLHAYTGSGTGTLTSTANGAMSASTFRSDGVTLAVGDQVFIQAGVTNVTAKDSGPWVVSSLGAAGAPWVITRPQWFLTGIKIPAAATVKVGGEGAVYQNTNWRATAASGTVVDTTDCAFYVEEFTFQTTLGGTGTAYQTISANQPGPSTNYPLTGGTATASSCPVGCYSATKTQIICNLVNSSIPTVGVGYCASAAAAGALNTSASCVAGYTGTAAFTVVGVKATGVVNSNADVSTIQVTIKNFG